VSRPYQLLPCFNPRKWRQMGGINWGKTHTGPPAQKGIRLKGGSAPFCSVCLSFCMFINVYEPKIFKYTRFNSYITEYQKELLSRRSQKEHRPITDLVREAIHCWLRERGIDDELIYDQKDHERWLEEIVSGMCK